MPVTIDLPNDVEEQLRRDIPNLDAKAKESLLIALYSERRLSIGRLGRILGVGVLGADQWLADRGVTLSYTSDDFAADEATSGELRSAG